MNYRDSNRVICLQFRPYSCGRFVSNVLSYNNNFLPQYNLDDETSLDTYTDISYKHQVILNTLPNTEHLKEWRKYELGCDKFYGIKMYEPTLYRKIFHTGTNTINRKHFTDLLSQIKNRAKEILATTNLYTFIVSHHNVCTNLVKEIFPNSILIEFINDEYVNRISKKIKTSMPDSNAPVKIVHYSNESYKFDIGTLFCQNEFFTEINKLMNYLDTNTELDSKVYEYYEKYKSIYEPYLNSKLCKK